VKTDLFRQLQRSLLYMAAMFTISVAGYLIDGWNLIDSLYMVVITVLDMRFGEVRPITTVVFVVDARRKDDFVSPHRAQHHPPGDHEIHRGSARPRRRRAHAPRRRDGRTPPPQTLSPRRQNRRRTTEPLRGHLLILAIQRANGNVLKSGFLEEKLQEGDAVVIVGRIQPLPPALLGEVEREELAVACSRRH